MFCGNLQTMKFVIFCSPNFFFFFSSSSSFGRFDSCFPKCMKRLEAFVVTEGLNVFVSDLP